MSDEKPAREPIGEDARIDALEERLKAAREREDQRNEPKVKGADASYKAGSRALADLLGGLLGGAVVGWTIGYFTDTNPWALLIGLGLGIVVAFRNIIRNSSRPPE
ncbi:AtpZ/AtpI family protein [Aurantiacibacter gangjinensis]|uniref:Uncharacterized protein n=1 Tax=Aurantiacibacter gangjinensis TaxID=502682 RepID=A0A0G9MQ27_9SPHN|nr:AtpZ/AtpI family protein [Aurantiacibacter gangjinensis]APE28458.1 ATP synthase protein I [Aurantiacibacter gangjinensis]KLE32669.1 hypothetical protein AAW01_01015 [Aurantiacibacter gangjinensis]